MMAPGARQRPPALTLSPVPGWARDTASSAIVFDELLDEDREDLSLQNHGGEVVPDLDLVDPEPLPAGGATVPLSSSPSSSFMPAPSFPSPFTTTSGSSVASSFSLASFTLSPTTSGILLTPSEPRYPTAANGVGASGQRRHYHHLSQNQLVHHQYRTDRRGHTRAVSLNDIYGSGSGAGAGSSRPSRSPLRRGLSGSIVGDGAGRLSSLFGGNASSSSPVASSPEDGPFPDSDGREISPLPPSQLPQRPQPVFFGDGRQRASDVDIGIIGVERLAVADVVDNDDLERAD